MSHTIRDKKKLLDRVRRLQGQLAGIERALDEEHDSARILHAIATCRGGIQSLMAEVMEGHIRLHVLDEGRRSSKGQADSAEQLIDVIKSYLK